jgi:hypothetical protein
LRDERKGARRVEVLVGREGWVGESKCEGKERGEVVGRVKGKGIVGVVVVVVLWFGGLFLIAAWRGNEVLGM